MVERLFFSKLVTKNLTAITSSRRLFEGVLTVEMKDRQGEITVRDELLKVLPIWIARGGPITDTHSNRVVGQGINFGSTTVTDEKGKSYPAITIQGEIFRDYELDDEIWKAIKSGKYKGLSFGGATKSNRTPIMQKDGSIAYSLRDLEQYEVAVCEEPAVPLALITQHNEIAKAMAGNVKDRGDGTMCIRCDKFKCYVDKGYSDKGDDSYADVNGPNSPNKDEDAEALENNRGEPQENGATYHGTDKTYRDPDPTETDPKKIEANALTASKQIQVKDDKAIKPKDDDEMLEEADLEEVEKILPLIGMVASRIGGAAAGAARGAAGAARGAAGAARGAARGAAEELAPGPESCDSSCDMTCEDVCKGRTTEGDEIEYDQTNEAGEKVNRFGRKIPGVMSKKPSNVDTAQDKPGTRHSTRVAGLGSAITPSSPNMTGEALQRRSAGNWNKPSGKQQPKRDKVGNKQVRARSTVTHDHETGITTVDPSGTKGGSKKIVTMPTSDYFNNPKYIRAAKKALDVLLLLLKFKFKPLTSESRREHIQDTKVPGTENNQDKLQQEVDYINTGTKIKPTGSGAKLSDEDKELGKALQIIKVEARKIEILEKLKKLKYNDTLKTDYNTCEVVREYKDDESKDEEDSKKKALDIINDINNILKTEQKLHARNGTSNFIHGRHFVTTNGKISNHDGMASHEEQVRRIGHKDLSSFLKETGAARVTHNDKNNEFSVHTHRPMTSHQEKTIRNHMRDNKIDERKVIFDNYHDKGPGETGDSHTHHSKIFPKGNHNNMNDNILTDKATGEAPYTEPGRGGFAGREPGETCDHNESTSIHNVNQPKHVNRPYKDEDAEALKKEVGDVYHPGNTKFDPKNPKHVKEFSVRWEDAKETNTNKKPATSSTGLGGNSCSNFSIHETVSNKNDRAMTANNAEDGINGKMRLDNDPPAEALEETTKKVSNDKKYMTGDSNDKTSVEGKNIDREINPGQDTSITQIKQSTGVMDPGSGAGGIRTGASYDNSQQDTGQKDNPRKVEEENYTGEEDRGNLNPKYSGENDTVSGASTENYNKSAVELLKLLLDIKKQISR
jgi:hypothetical protein